MYAVKHPISFTTNSSGAVTAYTPTDVNGRILQVQYVKDDLSDGATITLTGRTTGVPIFAITGMNASATHAIDGPVLATEQVKVVVSGGGNAKNGTLHITSG